MAVICTTSGTTGRPKLAMLSHGNLLAMGRSLNEVDPIGSGARYLSFLPLAWIGEQMIAVATGLQLGFTLSFAEEAATQRADLRELGPNLMFSPPRIWEDMLSCRLYGGQPRNEETARCVTLAKKALALAETANNDGLMREAWRMMAYALTADEPGIASDSSANWRALPWRPSISATTAASSFARARPTWRFRRCSRTSRGNRDKRATTRTNAYNATNAAMQSTKKALSESSTRYGGATNDA